MGQRDEIELSPRTANAKTATDHLVEFSDLDELRDRQFPDRNDEARLQDFDFSLEPGRTIGDLLRIRNPIASPWRFPRETTTDRGKIYSRANFIFIQTSGFLEPTKKGLARGPGERFPCHWFTHAWRLTNQQHLAQDRATRDGRRMHQRATAAVAQARDVPLESGLFFRPKRHFA